MDYYSASKKDKLLPFAATRMELEGIILNTISKKERYQMASFKCRIKKPNKGSRT